MEALSVTGRPPLQECTDIAYAGDVRCSSPPLRCFCSVRLRARAPDKFEVTAR